MARGLVVDRMRKGLSSWLVFHGCDTLILSNSRICCHEGPALVVHGFLCNIKNAYIHLPPQSGLTALLNRSPNPLAALHVGFRPRTLLADLIF